MCILLVACGGDSAPPAEQPQAPPTAADGPAPAAGATSPPTTVADLFPPGDGRELVLGTCANCHAVACAAMGQRTDARWRELEEAHREHVPALSEEDRQRVFAYLRTHFNDQRPEPDIPPAFLAQGCTPF